MQVLDLEVLSGKQKKIIIDAYKHGSSIKRATNEDISLLKKLYIVSTDLENEGEIYYLSETGRQCAKILIDQKRTKKSDAFLKWMTLLISLIALILSVFNTYNDVAKENETTQIQVYNN